MKKPNKTNDISGKSLVEYQKIEKGLKNLESSGFKRAFNYFLAVIKREDYIKKIEELKVKYKIPLKGFGSSKLIIPPVVWVYSKDAKKLSALRKEVKGICDKFSLDYQAFSNMIEQVLFYCVLCISCNNQRLLFVCQLQGLMPHFYFEQPLSPVLRSQFRHQALCLWHAA